MRWLFSANHNYGMGRAIRTDRVRPRRAFANEMSVMLSSLQHCAWRTREPKFKPMTGLAGFCRANAGFDCCSGINAAHLYWL
jgi:hypothetical protein